MRMISLVASAIVLAASPAFAASLSEAEAIRTALAASPSVRSADMALQATQARALAAGAWANPSLVTQVQLSSNPGANMLTLGFKQPLDFRRLADQRREAAQEEVEAARLGLLQANRRARHEARVAYVGLWLAEALSLSHDRHVAFFEGELERGRKRVALGALASHELVHVEFELAQSQLARQAARHEAVRARSRLNYLLGRPGDAPLAMPPVAISLPALGPIEAWQAEGGKARAELELSVIAARREQRLARLAESLRFGEGELDLQAGTTANTDPTLYGAFAMPVPLWNARDKEAEAARAEAARFEAERDVWARHVAIEIADAYLATQQAGERLKEATDSLVPLAGHALEKAEARLKAGVGRPTELIEARKQQLDAESARLKAVLEYHLAHARLEQAAGR